MAGKVRHLVERNGRYWARIVVPLHLRSILKKSELRESLGAGRSEALRLLPAVSARLLDQVAAAEAQLTGSAPKHRTMPLANLAKQHYAEELATDERMRNIDWTGHDVSYLEANRAATPSYKAALIRVVAGDVACCRFRGHPVWVFHEAGGGQWEDDGLGVSSRLRLFA
jgi:hypothetical protein